MLAINYMEVFMHKQLKNLAAVLLFGFSMGQAQAGVVFAFSESGGNVLMNTSGVLNTANLVRVWPSGWGGVGIETNVEPQSDIMGDTSMGWVDMGFGFHDGTDLTPWIGGMFTSSNFGWSTQGTTQFATYICGLIRTPGIGISNGDLVGSLWTPDVSWQKVGTFASLGLTPGDYTITDSVTNEFISIQIGDVVSVPEPASIALLGLGLVGFGFMRRKQVS